MRDSEPGFDPVTSRVQGSRVTATTFLFDVQVIQIPSTAYSFKGQHT